MNVVISILLFSIKLFFISLAVSVGVKTGMKLYFEERGKRK